MIRLTRGHCPGTGHGEPNRPTPRNTYVGLRICKAAKPPPEGHYNPGDKLFHLFALNWAQAGVLAISSNLITSCVNPQGARHIAAAARQGVTQDATGVPTKTSQRPIHPS